MRICSDSAASHERWKPVYGEGSMGTTMKTKNSGEGNQWSQCVQRRYVQKASLPDITAAQGVSSLSGDSKTAHHSPACMLEPSRNAVPFGTGVDTHTHTQKYPPGTMIFSIGAELHCILVASCRYG